jgi:hypothetical protein
LPRLLGQEQLEVVASEHLVGGVAGHLFGEGIEVGDRPVRLEDDNHAVGRLDERAEGGLAPLAGQGEPLAFGDAVEARPQGIGVDRLEDVVRGPAAERVDRPFHVAVPGDDDHGRLGSKLLEPRQQLLGRAVGQPPVEDDRIEPRPVARPERLGRRAGRFDRMPVDLENVPEVRPRIGVVFDHQDGEGVGVGHGGSARLAG